MAPDDRWLRPSWDHYLRDWATEEQAAIDADQIRAIGIRYTATRG